MFVPLDFRKAVVAPGETAGSMVLTVTGDKPRDAQGGAKVKLQPLTYEVQPEYWKIEVLWDPENAIFPVVTPFTVSLPLDGIQGAKGIEVIGQTKKQKIAISS
jgi:hypothetical protein